MESLNTDNSTNELPKGMAAIKKEFLKLNHVVEVNTAYVDPSNEKKKLKGRNRKRPHQSTLPKNEKLCLRLLSEEGCPYKDSCCFSHNIEAYLNSKPPDLGSSCYLYHTFGRCGYGITCRFGSEHLDEQNQNKVQSELWEKWKQCQLTSNHLAKDIQISLRKNKYDFGQANSIIKHLKQQRSQPDIILKNSLGSIEGKDIANSLQENDKIDEGEKGLNIVFTEPNSLHLEHPLGPCPDHDLIKLKLEEKKKIDFKDKLYLAPLTTVGNLPFRRVCRELGAEVTCGEMALALNLLQGHPSEWALLRRHHSEPLFGVQICGAHVDLLTRCAQLLEDQTEVDFVDINMGCPLDLVCNKGAGCGLMTKGNKVEDIVVGMTSVLTVPLTLKMRTGVHEGKNIAHQLITRLNNPLLRERISLFTIHGRSKEQRYTRVADWSYINQCSQAASPIPLFGGGDVLSFEDYEQKKQEGNVAGIMIARGALIKPWIFTEIKERRHWDISSSERMDLLKRFTNYGLEHWGSDTEGVEKTRRFLLEWLSFLYRYIPVGLLERMPQKINERPPPYFGRNDLETLMASPSCRDWITISEMLLGPVPENFAFLPKHKANAYQ